MSSGYAHGPKVAANLAAWVERERATLYRLEVGLPALPSDDVMALADALGVSTTAAVEALRDADVPIDLVLTEAGEAVIAR